MNISVAFTAANGQTIALSFVPSFQGGTWSTLPTPYLCAASGQYSGSSLGWPSDLTLKDDTGAIMIEMFAFDPNALGNTGNGALRCGTDANFPQDTGSLGTPGNYTWKVL